MTAKRHARLALAGVYSVLVVAGSVSALAACGGGGGGDDGGGPAAPGGDAGEGPAGGGGAGPAAAAELAAIRIWFKLDPRLTTGHYMGDRWASPPTFHVAAQTGSSCTVEARAQSGEGSALRPGATWTPSDAGMVTVAPSRGGEVEITVHRAGRSSISVTDGAESTTLTVDAVEADGTWQVQLSQ